MIEMLFQDDSDCLFHQFPTLHLKLPVSLPEPFSVHLCLLGVLSGVQFK